MLTCPWERASSQDAVNPLLLCKCNIREYKSLLTAFLLCWLHSHTTKAPGVTTNNLVFVTKDLGFASKYLGAAIENLGVATENLGATNRAFCC